MMVVFKVVGRFWWPLVVVVVVITTAALLGRSSSVSAFVPNRKVLQASQTIQQCCCRRRFMPLSFSSKSLTISSSFSKWQKIGMSKVGNLVVGEDATPTNTTTEQPLSRISTNVKKENDGSTIDAINNPVKNGLKDDDDDDDDITRSTKHDDQHPQPQQPVDVNTARTQTKKKEKNYHWTRQNLALAVPAWMGLLADPILGLVDTAFVTRIGSIELAALGVCTSIYGMAFAVFHASTMATTSLVASATSQSEQQYITRTSLQLAMSLGILLLLTLRFGGTYALAAMGVSSTSLLYPSAIQYLTIRCYAAPAVLCMVVAEGAFRGVGNTRIPLMASITAAMINLILDPILMFGGGGRWWCFKPFGVAGAAAATAMAQYGAVAVYAYYLKRRNMLPSWSSSTGSSSHGRRRQGLAAEAVAAAIGLFSPRENKNNKLRVQNANNLSSRPLQQDRYDNQDESVMMQSQPSLSTSTTTTTNSSSKGRVVLRTILGANMSMLAKQGSLLVFYTYAAAMATRFGVSHVAAHQIGLSLWLLFTWWLDAASVSGQVLMSRTISTATTAEECDRLAQVKSLIKYMIVWAIGQGLVSTLGMMVASHVIVPRFMKLNDMAVQEHLAQLLPQLTWQQTLISLVLVLESLVIGGKQFYWMAIGTFVCTVLAAIRLHLHHGLVGSVTTIWSHGFFTLFVTRLISAMIGTWRVIRNVSIEQERERGKKKTMDNTHRNKQASKQASNQTKNNNGRTKTLLSRIFSHPWTRRCLAN